jgi:WD40 repeat protein
MNMSKLLQSSMVFHGIALAGEGRTVKAAKVCICTDYVVVIDDSCRVLVCRISTGECWHVPVSGKACSTAIYADKEFVVASDDGSIQRFDLTLPTICIGKITVPFLSSVAYDHTGTMLVVGRSDGRVSIFDLETRPLPQTIVNMRVGDASVTLLRARKDNVIGVTSQGRLFCLRNPECDPQIVWNGAEHSDWDCYAIAVHPFLMRIALAGHGPYIRLYVGYDAKPVVLVSKFSFVRDLVFCSDLHQLVVVGDSGLEVWDLELHCVEFSWQIPQGKVLCARPIDDKLAVIWS